MQVGRYVSMQVCRACRFSGIRINRIYIARREKPFERPDMRRCGYTRKGEGCCHQLLLVVSGRSWHPGFPGIRVHPGIREKIAIRASGQKLPSGHSQQLGGYPSGLTRLSGLPGFAIVRASGTFGTSGLPGCRGDRASSERPGLLRVPGCRALVLSGHPAAFRVPLLSGLLLNSY
jgi:hypothetical protein